MPESKEKKLEYWKPAPDFCLKSQENKDVCLKDFKGKWVVLYFYPKDNTLGCTIEALDFTKLKPEFEKLGAVILGISTYSPASHASFCEKKNLKITLLSDPNHVVAEKYYVWKPKTLYGKEFLGMQRSTFLINPNSQIAHYWYNVRAVGHAPTVLETLKELK